MLVPPRLLLCTTTVLLLPVCCAITAVESTAGCLAVTITVAVLVLLLPFSATHYSANQGLLRADENATIAMFARCNSRTVEGKEEVTF